MSLASNLYALGALMKTNLEYKGITGLTGNEGLTTLANKILDISCKEKNTLILTVTGDSFTLGSPIEYTGQISIDWGDGTVETNVNPNSRSHTYNDGLAEHTVVLTGEITSLGELCFSSCSTLTSVIIPNSVTTLGVGCFTDCSALTSVIIPDSVTTLGNYCFDNCFGLTSVIIPDSVTTLGDYCFSVCSALTSVIIPNSVTTLGVGCFTDCSALTSVIIPNSVTTLGKNCFENCFGLTSVIIPDSVTTLGDYCFSVCSGLTSVIIPNSVTTLGKNCFDNCFGLTSVIIPDSVTTLDENCFLSCSGLIDYELYWESSPISYDSYKMPNNTNTVFTIPVGTTQLYIDAGYPSAKLMERHEYELYVTRDKKIIQTNEDVTLIGMLMRDGEAAVGETLTYQVLHEGSVVDSSSGVTDDNGLAEITYTGTGIGEVEITVKYGTLLQETYEVLDAIVYDKSTNASDFWTYWDCIKDSANTVTVDNTGTLIETDASQYTSTYMQLYLDDFTNYIDVPIVYELDIISLNNYSFCYPIQRESNTWWASTVLTGHIKIIITSNNAKFYQDGVLKSSVDGTYLKSRCYLQSQNARGNGSVKFKNLRIYRP